MKNSVDGRKCLINGCNHICNYRGHHIKTIGSGGKDEPFNIMPLCPNHHNMQKDSIHLSGVWTFVKNHPEVEEYLVDLGWQKCDITKRWYHDGNNNKKRNF